MKVVVLANLRWYVKSPSLYQLACPVMDDHEDYPIYLGFNGEQWYMTDGRTVVMVPDRETGAMLLAKQLNKDAAGNGP